MKFLLDFLFGKGPDIFDEQGRVVHKHPKSKWEAWNKYKSREWPFMHRIDIKRRRRATPRRGGSQAWKLL